MSKFQALISRSDFSFWICSNPRGGFALCELAPVDLDAIATREDFVGVVGFQGFVPKVALAIELDDASTRAISRAIVSLVEAAIIRIEASPRIYC